MAKTGEQPSPGARRLAEILALAADARWSASFPDENDSVIVTVKSQRLPGGCGLHIELRWLPGTWHVRPGAYRLRPEEAGFWTRFSSRDSDPFGGFDITTADLADVLPPAELAIVLDGLRSIAGRREAAAFRAAATARGLRTVIGKYDRAYACPVRVAPGRFEDAGHRLRVERVTEPDELRPENSWVLRDLERRVRDWPLPGWWATRRAADDEARRFLSRKEAGNDG